MRIFLCRLLEEIEEELVRRPVREEMTKHPAGDLESVLLEKRELTRRLGLVPKKMSLFYHDVYVHVPIRHSTGYWRRS
jgi:hypothetical protein